MELTPDQLAAAEACGCTFSPATEDQARRLTMQRRIFSVEGRPFVAARAGFLETHGTLTALIENHRPVAPERNARADPAPVPERAATSDTEGAAATSGAPASVESGAVRAEWNAGLTSGARPRKPRAPRRKSAPADTDAAPADSEAGTGEIAAPADESTALPSEAEEMLAGVEALQSRGPRARVVGVRRAGQPPTPRWMVAGKVRRGRLK